MPEWEYRYYSFYPWESGEFVFSMRNGSGDEMFVVFVNGDVLVKGFAHESDYTPYRSYPPEVLPGILENVPNELAYLLSEPALTFSDTTFCFWWQGTGEKKWTYGRKPRLDQKFIDGSDELLQILDGNPQTYHQWAIDYYEEQIPFDAVEQIYDYQPLNTSLILSLNKDAEVDGVLAEALGIGYPVSSSE